MPANGSKEKRSNLFVILNKAATGGSGGSFIFSTTLTSKQHIQIKVFFYQVKKVKTALFYQNVLIYRKYFLILSDQNISKQQNESPKQSAFMKKWSIFILVLLPLGTLLAQSYKYIGVEDGLSNRRVSSIEKDKKGYMWFLSQEGVDRYNGKDFKQYKIAESNDELAPVLNLTWLYIDNTSTIWQIGRNGKIFQYVPQSDKFVMIYKLPEDEATEIDYSFIDNNQRIWLCTKEKIYLYNIRTKETTTLHNEINEAYTDIRQVDNSHFYIGTEVGVHYANLENTSIHLLPVKTLEDIDQQVNELYYHPQLKQLYIGTLQKGVIIYNTATQQSYYPYTGLNDISISRIKPLNENELLIATDGAGVYKMNAATHLTEPYIVADYSLNNSMNGNSINDIYVDEEQRIWLANNPIGITVRNNKYATYKWIKHSIGNDQSLINDHVNMILEDGDNDLWYATNNGVSLYNSQTGRWHSFLSSFDKKSDEKNHIFTTLCEVSPGVIWAAGYSSGIYQINKKTLSTSYFTPYLFYHLNIRPDKYIRSIMKDSAGEIWSGGYYNLKKISADNKTIRLYNGLSNITSIIERNSNQMWIGSAAGLYLLDKESGKFEHVLLPVESSYIHCLYQSPAGLLYIGTSGSGMLVYQPETRVFTHYFSENCAIISNNIYTIIGNTEDNLMISTEEGLVFYTPSTQTFQNWTKEQGLMTIHFNPSSGILRKNNNYVMGSADGAVEFNKNMRMPRTYSSRMILSDLSIFYQTVYPGEKGSPIATDIDDVKTLKLKYNQNTFAVRVSSINYDYPSNILYSYMLKGFYDEWSRPSNEYRIRFTNLNPGKYTLYIRAVSAEDKRIVLEEREMNIVIDTPFWLTIWAILFYLIIVSLITIGGIRMLWMRKQRKVSNEKIDFFINTAHDIRTPLTLIKAPLEELIEKETLSRNGTANMNTAMRNVNALLHLTTNLINFERADVYSSELYITEHELNIYMSDIMNSFRQYAETKHIDFTYNKNFEYLNVWFDKEKMDSVLKNVISNALKYTPENGSVKIIATEHSDSWSIEVKDTGIGVPSSEQNKLFKIHFRGSNAINSKVTGSGIGLMLVRKLVVLHNGKITFNSVENKGSVVRINIPKEGKYIRKAHLINHPTQESKQPETYQAASLEVYENVKRQSDQQQQRIMVVEDNDELRKYLEHTLSEDYSVQTFANGKDALTVVKEYKPELIISDIMMPEMRGDELCAAIKNDIETSHIPVILLTALNDEKNIMDSLQIGADKYIIKPFNLGIMKASIASLLANRALLRNKYANLELQEEEETEDDCNNCNTDLDWKFISAVKKQVEINMDNPAFNVDVLCNLLNMSRTSFYNKLKALTDQAPGDYIRLIRLKRAGELLKAGEHNITEIAEMTGFSDAKYFREVFKRHYNVSPSKYGKGEGADENADS